MEKQNSPDEFSDDIFSFRRITLAPIVVLAGFIFEIWAIMKKPKEGEEIVGSRKTEVGSRTLHSDF